MAGVEGAAIVGIGQTRFAREMGRTELDLACEAVIAACADAGLAPTDIDGVVRYHVEQVDELDLAYALGIPAIRFFALTPSGGGGVANTLTLAAMAIATGQADVVVAFRARNRSKTASYAPGQNQGGRPWAKVGPRVHGNAQWHHPFGVAAPVQEMALIARRHMAMFGTTAEQFGAQAVAQRFHASRNPAAIMQEPITLEEWASARMIADPIRLPDCSLENDGAVAVVLTTTERARDLRQTPVAMLAGTMAEHPVHVRLADYFEWTSAFGANPNRAHLAAGRRLFAAASLTPDDVDVALVFDHFTMAVPLTLEQFGFCGMGEGGPMIESGATRWPAGRLPVNTHGGSNGEAFIHGYNHIAEAVRQLRGSAVNQVQDAEVAFVNGAITDPSGAVLLGRG